MTPKQAGRVSGPYEHHRGPFLNVGATIGRPRARNARPYIHHRGLV